MKYVVSEFDDKYEYGYYHDSERFYNNLKINDKFNVVLPNNLKYENFVDYHQSLEVNKTREIKVVVINHQLRKAAKNFMVEIEQVNC